MTDRPMTTTAPREQSVGELVSQVSEQTSRLIRDELRLAQLEMAQKGKKAGIGAGLFGGAGLFAAYGFGCLVAAAVLALAGPLSGWLAAVIVGVALFVVAAVIALVGKRKIVQAAPPVPTEAVSSVKADVQAIKSGGHR
jgi:VIT1/CCC1 family predicted Fe2+/Mn2+ transporter